MLAKNLTAVKEENEYQILSMVVTEKQTGACTTSAMEVELTVWGFDVKGTTPLQALFG